MEQENSLSIKVSEFLKIQKDSISTINQLTTKVEELKKSLDQLRNYNELTVTLNQVIDASKKVNLINEKIKAATIEVGAINNLGTKLIEMHSSLVSVESFIEETKKKTEDMVKIVREYNMDSVKENLYEVITVIKMTTENINNVFDEKIQRLSGQVENVSNGCLEIKENISMNNAKLDDIQKQILSQNEILNKVLSIIDGDNK